MAIRLRAFLLAALACLALASPAPAQQSGHYSLLTVTRQFTNSGATTLGATTFSGITGATQCLHVNSSGSISGTGSDCGSGGGGSGTLNSVTDGTNTVSSPTQLSVTNGAVVSNPSGSVAQIALPLAPPPLEQHTASSSATLDFTTGITGACTDYNLHLQNILPATNGVSLHIQIGTGASLPSSGWDTGTNYNWAMVYVYTATPYGPGPIYGHSGSGAGASDFMLADTQDNTTAEGGVSGDFQIINPNSSTQDKMVLWHVGEQNSTINFNLAGNGLYYATTAVTGLRLVFSSGNIASGRATLTCTAQ